jgi:hypothetical protein
MNDNKLNKEIYVFYHLYQTNLWQDFFCEQMLSLKNSGLYDYAKKIFVCVNGSNELPFYTSKLTVYYNDKKYWHSEAGTLKHLYKFCNNTNCLVCYFHSKGVSKSTFFVNSWRRYLESFIFFKWKTCVKLLTTNDVVGVEWKTNDLMLQEFRLFKNFYGYFSGNFWWANSTYISQLNLQNLFSLTNTSKQKIHPRILFTLPELWIGSNNPKVYNFQTLSGFLPADSFYNKNAIIEKFNEENYNYS